VRLAYACRLDEIPHDRGLLVEVGGRALAVFRQGERVHALENGCPHRDGPLAFGDVRGGTVFCPVHAWPFDLETGRCRELPGVSVKVFPVRLEGEAVWIEL
jgi:nitrite reductase (NADH) small subunit